MSQVFKRVKRTVGTCLESGSLSINSKSIGTHSGTFQADEAMGVWMLQQLEQYRHSPVIRSRDPDVLASCHIVLDVGGIYNHAQLRYDHHQRDYDERFPPTPSKGQPAEHARCTKLSASGLIYRHYGRELLQSFYPSLTGDYLEIAYFKIYDLLLEALDAIDTGVEIVPGDTPVLYKDSTGLSSRVNRLNPRWNEIDENTGHPPVPDERFALAVDCCGQEFLSVMTVVVESDLPAFSIVAQAFGQRFETDESGCVLCFPNGGLPWKQHLYELEREHDAVGAIKFVLYQDQSDMWRVQAVTVEGQSFTNRLSLPSAWRGLRDAQLENVCQIPAVRFVHAAGFIGGADSYESALNMARRTLDLEKIHTE